jgi:uncharacterized protein YyaL (SSP411 family)
MNELKNALSSYLVNLADSPIDWKIYNDSSLELAKLSNKPIFLSIGYFSCRWCHVMEREVFYDEEVAKIMNDNFVCIKVDREEMPHLDSFYINALMVLTGSAGWPANLFLTPSLKPFFGFTYLPKKNFLKVISQISEMWKDQREELLNYAEKVYSYLSFSYLDVVNDGKYVFKDFNKLEEFLYLADRTLNSILDFRGGFSFRPKFPPHQLLEYLLLRFTDNPSKYVLECLDKTLSNMILGGMYDLVDGGFCRYSVDENWMVPHFEKMLYDNSFLLFIYSMASKIFETLDYNKSMVFKKIALDTFDFLNNFLKNDDGMFYSSLSAESLDGNIYREGAYYLFSEDDIKNIDYHKYFSFHRFFDHHESYGGLIVHYKHFPNWEDFSEIDLIREKFRKIRELKDKQNLKRKPEIDNKVILSWNAILSCYLLKSYVFIGNKSFLDTALNIIEFILKNMVNSSGELWRVRVGNTNYIEGILEDYLWLSLALFYASNYDSGYLDLSKKFFEKSKKFLKDGIFYDSEQINSYDVFDNSLHSKNSIGLLIEFLLYDRILNEDYCAKVLSFEDNLVYFGSLLYFLSFYKLKKTGLYCESVKFENDSYIVRFLGEDIRVLSGETKRLTFNVCDDKKCFEVVKVIDF